MTPRSVAAFLCVAFAGPAALADLQVRLYARHSPVGLHAQTPSFEAASVKKNAGGGPPGLEIRVTPNGGFIATNVPLRVLVRESFRVQDYQVIDLPGWADGERYDITARSAGASPDWQPMVQSLLRDRFALSARRETREMPIYAVASVREGRTGPSLKPTAPATTAYCTGQRLDRKSVV